MTKKKGQSMRSWLASRPMCVQQAAKTWPPNGYYLLKTTGQKGNLYSYEERPVGRCTTCKFFVKEGYNIGFLVWGVLLTELELLPKKATRTKK